MSGLEVRRMPNETWREAVERIADYQGLRNECLDEFDANIRANMPEESAAWSALYQWDCLDYVAAPTQEGTKTNG